MKRSVLIVEDEPALATLLKDALGRDGHTLHVCGTAGEARHALRDGMRPDVVLLDLMPPDEPGAALIDDLRPITGTIVAMSCSNEHLAAASSYVDHVLRKPFTIAEVRTLVRHSA